MLRYFADRTARVATRTFLSFAISLFVLVAGAWCMVASTLAACVISLFVLGKWLVPLLFVLFLVSVVFL